jgi:hypothetical protein
MAVTETHMTNGPQMSVLAFVIIVILTLLGCSPSVLHQEPYRAYYGVHPGENELATLDLGIQPAAIIIDDMYVVSGNDYRTVKLIAGMHTIKLHSAFGTTAMVEPSGVAALETIQINFEPGHTYRLFLDTMTTGKIVNDGRTP